MKPIFEIFKTCSPKGTSKEKLNSPKASVVVVLLVSSIVTKTPEIS